MISIIIVLWFIIAWQLWIILYLYRESINNKKLYENACEKWIEIVKEKWDYIGAFKRAIKLLKK